MSEQATETETKTDEKTLIVRPRTRFMWFAKERLPRLSGDDSLPVGSPTLTFQ